MLLNSRPKFLLHGTQSAFSLNQRNKTINTLVFLAEFNLYLLSHCKIEYFILLDSGINDWFNILFHDIFMILQIEL